MPRTTPKRKATRPQRIYSTKELNWVSEATPHWTEAEWEDPLWRDGPAVSGWQGPSPMVHAPQVRRVGVRLIQREDNPPKRLFRFFAERKHAEDFASGRIWISTLETCRKFEDPQQGDPDEGTLGMKRIKDALVICTTLRFDPLSMYQSFGLYCVEITQPFEFFIKVTEELLLRYPIDRYRQAGVIYADRDHDGRSPPGRIGFVKPADQYASQEEHRMLWTVNVDTSLTPGFLTAPELKNYCRVIVQPSDAVE